jgi:hypothetical protein
MTMDESRMTVGEAVDFEASFGEKLREALREKLSAVRAAMGPPIFEAAVDKVVEQAAKVLDAPVADLLSAAWARYPEIQELCDARKHPGGDHEAMAELCEHRFEWRYEPRIEVVFNEIPIAIPLGVGVGLDVAGGVLVVQGGRLKELRSGKVGVQVAMAVAEQEVASRKAKVELPAVLRLGGAAPAREAVPVGKIAAPAGVAAVAEPAAS